MLTRNLYVGERKRNHNNTKIDAKKLKNAFSQQNLSESPLYEQSLLSEHDAENASDTVYKAKPRDSQLRNLLDLYSCSMLVHGKDPSTHVEGRSFFPKLEYNH